VLKIALGILTGILIFIAAGILATYWLENMRREKEQKRPQLAMIAGRQPSQLFDVPLQSISVRRNGRRMGSLIPVGFLGNGDNHIVPLRIMILGVRDTTDSPIIGDSYRLAILKLQDV